MPFLTGVDHSSLDCVLSTCMQVDGIEKGGFYFHLG